MPEKDEVAEATREFDDKLTAIMMDISKKYNVKIHTNASFSQGVISIVVQQR